MANKVLLAFVGADILFAITGAIMVAFSVIVKNTCTNTPTEGAEAARNLIYQQFPLTAGIVNAVFIFVTFLVSIPAMMTPSRGLLKVAGYMAVFCALFSMIIGLDLWILTLRTKEELSAIWLSQSASVQDLMQTAFTCCGFFNSTSPAFVTDSTCPSPAAAALMKGCATPLTSFANVFIDDIFTAVFGMVGIDAALILATACLLKDRKERERFRHIDEKSGARGTF